MLGGPLNKDRKLIIDLIDQLNAQADEYEGVAADQYDKALERRSIADRLSKALPKLTDEECGIVTAKMKAGDRIN